VLGLAGLTVAARVIEDGAAISLMHALAFLQDLAVVMIVAGLVTVTCHRLRQSVVLGYIIAGIGRNGANLINPGPDEELQAGDDVLILGSGDQLSKARDALTRAEA